MLFEAKGDELRKLNEELVEFELEAADELSENLTQQTHFLGGNQLLDEVHILHALHIVQELNFISKELEHSQV